MNDFIRCDGCGMYRPADHPISVCHSCEKETYEAKFAELRKQTVQAGLIGTDPYRDDVYIYAGDQVFCFGGQLLRTLQRRDTDSLIRRVSDLEAENTLVLAENARLRRRLDGKPPPSGGT